MYRVEVKAKKIGIYTEEQVIGSFIIPSLKDLEKFISEYCEIKVSNKKDGLSLVKDHKILDLSNSDEIDVFETLKKFIPDSYSVLISYYSLRNN